MQFLTRSLYVNENAQPGNPIAQGYVPGEEYDEATQSYLERLDEICGQLPKGMRLLAKDADWNDGEKIFLKNQFYISTNEEQTLHVMSSGYLFILQYTLEHGFTPESPDEAEELFFKTEKFGILEEEFDIEDGKPVHRLLFTNGWTVDIHPKEFHCYKTKIIAEA